MSTNTTYFPLRNPFFLTWLAFTCIILGAIIIIHPGWGFMDDYNNLDIARNFWLHPSLQNLKHIVIGDINIGRFQPLYKLWILSAYKAGAQSPCLIYFFTTLIGLLALPFWGMILDKIFNNGRRSPFWIWAYPLAFFIFIPFWNAFMYLSIQEKFIYFFSAPAIFFFLRAYEKKRWIDFIWAFICSFLAVLGKETGIILFLSFAAYAFFDAVLFKRQQILSCIICATNTVFFIIYYLFIQRLLRNYTAKYAENSHLSHIWENFNTSPFYIKLAGSLGLAILIWQFTREFIDVDAKENGRTLFAWLSLFYILILLPWGFPTYLLPPLAVFVVGAATPIFQAGDRWAWFQFTKRLILIILAFLTAVLIIIPQIEKMADKRKLVDAVKKLASTTPEATFFYPAPYEETATAIHSFSTARITYLPDSSLSSERLSPANHNYLLMNDECQPVVLTGISPSQTIYQNSTWKIYSLEPKAGFHLTFKDAPARNPLQRVTAFIKKL